MWDLPGPGLEPMSPALAGGFLTTAPPGKSLIITSYSSSKLPQNHEIITFCFYKVHAADNLSVDNLESVLIIVLFCAIKDNTLRI